jgi:hypothetical protein
MTTLRNSLCYFTGAPLCPQVMRVSTSGAPFLSFRTLAWPEEIALLQPCKHRDAMAHKSTFQKMKKSNKKMYGTRGILVCGYAPSEQRLLVSFLGQKGFQDLPVIFVTTAQSMKTLKELLALPDCSGQGEASGMRRAIIMSGFTQKELHKLMEAYRLAELPSQLWATLTPISENWSVTNLLEELAAESEAIKKQREGSKRPAHT